MNVRYFTGIAARNIALTHLKSIAFAMFVLWTIAVAIDLTKTLDSIREMAASQDVPLLPLAAEYLVYRTADIVVRLLPMASLVGGFTAELLRHQRMEPVILSAAGARPTLLFAALFGAGLVTGSIQLALEGWLRPAAVFAQADLGLGSYAHRFYQGDTGRFWFIEDDLAIEATVIRSNNPELLDIRGFVGVGEDKLERIFTAERAVPTEEPLVWELQNAVVWDGAGGTAMRPQKLPGLEIELSITQSHLQYHNILAFYLPNKALREIVNLTGTQRWQDAQTARMRRYVAIFLPGLFTLLGASLAQFGRSGRFFAWWRLLALGALGYINVVSVKSFWSLGEFGVLPPLAATILPMLLALLLSIALQTWMNGLPGPWAIGYLRSRR